MIVTTKKWHEPYEFEVIRFSDEENQKLIFLVRPTIGNQMLAEKTNPGGKWRQTDGGSFSSDLLNLIFQAIDKASFNKLMEDLKPIKQLGNYYHPYNTI